MKWNSPEHLNSWSCRSATFCPLSWLGEWHLVYGAKRGALRKNRDNQDKWQSHANGLSESLRARIRDIPVNISRWRAVTLLLLIVLWYERKFKYFIFTVFIFPIHIITMHWYYSVSMFPLLWKRYRRQIKLQYFYFVLFTDNALHYGNRESL